MILPQRNAHVLWRGEGMRKIAKYPNRQWYVIPIVVFLGDGVHYLNNVFSDGGVIAFPPME